MQRPARPLASPDADLRAADDRDDGGGLLLLAVLQTSYRPRRQPGYRRSDVLFLFYRDQIEGETPSRGHIRALVPLWVSREENGAGEGQSFALLDGLFPKNETLKHSTLHSIGSTARRAATAKPGVTSFGDGPRGRWQSSARRGISLATDRMAVTDTAPAVPRARPASSRPWAEARSTSCRSSASASRSSARPSGTAGARPAPRQDPRAAPHDQPTSSRHRHPDERARHLCV